MSEFFGILRYFKNKKRIQAPEKLLYMLVYRREICPKCVDGMTNCVDLDQTAPKGAKYPELSI